MQLGDVFAGQTINVVSADQTVASGTAVGNVVNATGQNADLSFTSTQQASGRVQGLAQTSAKADSGGYAGVTASATGNAGTAATCCGALTGSSSQTAGDREITAGAYLTLGAPTWQVSADSAAVGNTQGWLSTNGAVRASSTQRLTASVTAETGATVDEVTATAGASATAVGNDVTVQGTNSAVEIVTDQENRGAAVRAILTVQQQGGDTIAGQATATGNNVTVETTPGSTDSASVQFNAATVTADAAYGLGSWNSATVSSYGVGNSVLVSNTGAQTQAGIEQENVGAVTARSALTAGGGGGDTYVSATAVGNANQSAVCSTCEGGVGLQNKQTNSGAITASASYKGPQTGSVVGAASAVGNTASFTVRAPGG